MAGFSMNCDAYHALRPTDQGIGLIAAIQDAMIEAKVTPRMVDLFNCHATSTPAGDQAEANCIKAILSADQKVSVKHPEWKKGMSLDYFREIKPEVFPNFSRQYLDDQFKLPFLTA